MKTKSLFQTFRPVLIACLYIATLSCGKDEEDSGESMPTEMTITEYLSHNSEYSTLLSALTQTGLTEKLNNVNSRYTLLAPNNDAFNNLLEDWGFSGLQEINDSTLTNLLLNHLMENIINSLDLSGYRSTLAIGPDNNQLSILGVTSNGIRFNEMANTVPNKFDIRVANGMIHGIDAVLTPPTLWDHIKADPLHSMLSEAILKYGDELTQVLSGKDIHTVFAPMNNSFEDFLDAYNIPNLDALDKETLLEILSYHSVAEYNLKAQDLQAGKILQTVQGKELTSIFKGDLIELKDGSTFNCRILQSDIQSVNGVIHVVEKLLLPDNIADKLQKDLSVAGYFILNPDYSIMKHLIRSSVFSEDLGDPNRSYTVFAADNNAITTAFGSDFGWYDSYVDYSRIESLILSDKRLISELETGYYQTLATNRAKDHLSLYVNTQNGTLINGLSRITEADLEFRNGVIHKVDAINNQLNLLTFLQADPELKTLLSAMSRDNNFNFTQKLDNEGASAPFTLFAPDNQAFNSLLPELGLNTMADMASEELHNVLGTHLLTGQNIPETDLSNGTMLTMQNSTRLTVTITPENITLLDPRNRSSKILVKNIQAVNGVMHIIDKVLLPE